MWIFNFPRIICWRDFFIPILYFWYFCGRSVYHILGYISGLSILFHQSTYWSLFQYYSILISAILLYILKSGNAMPPDLLFLLKIAFVVPYKFYILMFLSVQFSGTKYVQNFCIYCPCFQNFSPSQTKTCNH